MNIVEWVTAAGEFLIAVAIILEMEENRRDRFLTEAAKIKNYRDRGKVYAAYYDIVGDSVEEKSATFCNRIWKDGEHEPEPEPKPELETEHKKKNKKGELKISCERQIILFGRLGQILKRALFFRRDYVQLFPHAVVMFWIMMWPYVEERRRMTGKWWASDFRHLTKGCLDFLLDEDPKATLTLYDSNRERGKDFIIPNDYLRQLQNQLNSD